LDGQYRALREQAGVLARPGLSVIAVSGPEAAEYLQGQLTNDVESLSPGEGAYAALLDRKGHLQADVRTLRTADREFLLVSEQVPGERLLRHLGMYKIGREVEIADRSAEHAMVSLIGPRSAELGRAESLADEHGHEAVELAGRGCRAIRTDLGVDLLCAAGDVAAVMRDLLSSGAEEVSPEAAEIARVESGRPRFGREMSERTMPAEAGIVERAVSFTKGCYIGQEPVARLHYRGRPNRLLRGLRLSVPAAPGDTLRLGDREVGEVATACVSPALGPLALAIVRREAEPGATLGVGNSGATATVSELPFAP
jgi:folate-binding protein YgfZ